MSIPFPSFDETNAPEPARAVLLGAKQKFGAIPKPLTAYASSPLFLRQALTGLDAFERTSLAPLEREVVAMTMGRVNGCGFCVDMHVKQAAIHGERPLRLHHVAIWRESPLFQTRERAALAWTEVLTQLPVQGVPDEVYERVRGQFSEQELTELTYHVMTINAWNRLNVAFRSEPGSQDRAFGLDKANLA